MEIPVSIRAQIEFLCESNNYGMLVVQGDYFNAIIMGSRKFSPDQISIIIAHALLRGVITSELNDLNEESKKKREEEPKM